MATLKGLLFDFDGLLCDTERAALISWVELYDSFDMTFPDGLWQRIVGTRDGACLAQRDLTARLGRDPDQELWRARRRRKSVLANQEPLRPGARELIGEATTRGVRLAVVSSSSRAWVTSQLTRLGVRHRFETFVCGEDVSSAKPAPDGYQAALDQLGVGAGEAVALEDSAVGVTAARAAGVRCVAVPGPHSGTSAHHADLVVASLCEIDLSVLDRLGSRDRAGQPPPR